MWIFLSIILFIILLITIIMLLPVCVILKTDHNGDIILRYKILFKVFGANPNPTPNPNPNNRIAQLFKKAVGVNRLDSAYLKKSTKEGSFAETLSNSLSLVSDLLKHLIALLKRCKIKTLKLNITCAGNDAAEAAIKYGQCCAVVAPFLGLIHSEMKVCKRGEDVNVTCDYEKKSSTYNFHVVLSVRCFSILSAFTKIVFDEVRRLAESNAAPHKTQK